MRNRWFNERATMKKPKHPNEREEPSVDSSEEIDVVLDDFGNLDDLDDEIIDLEDVIESYSERMEEDEGFTSDEEILDTEGDLDLGGVDGKAESDDEFLLEDDLLKELPFFQDEKAEPEPDRGEGSMAEEMEELPPGLFGDSGEEAIEEADGQTAGVIHEEPEVLDLPVAGPDLEEPELEESPLPIEASALDEAQPEVLVMEAAAPVIEELEPEVSAPPEEPSVPEEAQPAIFVPPVTAPVVEELEPEASATAVPTSVETGVPLDDFVVQIENRLVDAIREIVEARLPEIVRIVLREEIARLKSDQDPED
jgi:hypothetical protein